MLKNGNFAKATLAGNITDIATSLTVATGEGTKFPASGDFRVVIWGAAYSSPLADTTREIVTATLSSGDTLNIIRAQEGTTAKTWSATDNIALIITAGKIDEIEQYIKTLEDNIILLAFYRSVDSGATIYNLIDGIIDEFEDASGVDAASSTNETYDSVNDLYLPAAGASILTGGTATASSTYESAPAAKAVDDSTSTYWESNGSENPGWWKYDLGAGVSIMANKLTLQSDPANGGEYLKDFVLSGSNNDSDWTVLTTGQHANNTSVQTFSFASVSAYRYYKLSISSNWVSTNYFIIGEITLSVSSTNMALISNSVTADATPSQARLTVFSENIDSVTINTDFKGYISRDSGTTYTQVTLKQEGTWGSNKYIYSCDATDISSQPSGTSMVWKITTHNNKQIRIHGVGMRWDA